jgi:hypothetical protein
MVARADQMSVLIVGMFAGRWHPCCPFTPLRLRHVPLAAFSKLPRLPVRAEGAALYLVGPLQMPRLPAAASAYWGAAGAALTAG